METVRIDGVDYPYFGMTEDRRGIITEQRTFWMFPDCRHDGSPVGELPLIGPQEIKAVTFDEPDLTGLYPAEAKADFAQYRDYWLTVTPEEHATNHRLLPARDRGEDAATHSERVKKWLESYRVQFEECKGSHLAVSFDGFVRRTGIRNAWRRHGTPEFAEKHHFREYMTLYLGLLAQRVNRDDIIPRIWTLHYEACYPDPERTVIYLKDVRPEMHSPAVLRHVAEYRGSVSRTTTASVNDGAQIEWDYVNPQGTEWRKGGKHMMRRKDIAKRLRVDPAESGFRQLLEEHPERRFYPVKRIEAVRRKQRKGARLPFAALYDATDFDPSWHPMGAPTWTHPGRRTVSKTGNQC